MAGNSPPTRERIVAGAADMISRRGLTATSIRQMARHAQAPLGSTYHYFPEGKEQLATEAIRYTGARSAELLSRALQRGPVAGLSAFFALWRRTVDGTDFRSGCPVLAVSIEEPLGDEVPKTLIAAAEVFADWEHLLEACLREHGVEPEQAAELGTLIIAAVEGAVAMCRAKRSTEPLDRVAAQLMVLVAGAVER